ANACRGDKLDLRKLVATQACAVQGVAGPLPASVAVTVEPVTVKSGARIDAAIVLTNVSDQELVLVLDNSCDELARVSYEMHDAKGVRVDAGMAVCASDGGCIASQIGLAIAPRGTARVPFVFDPRTEEFDKACTATRVKPVPRGTYDVKVYWNRGELTTTATVR
ncbi:MAG: hypothetical protein H0W68_13345, partial [Gemmatimonadaceae bacterium]|nr:hypothetical protein [Gemmatimonadaceae bacterium]